MPEPVEETTEDTPIDKLNAFALMANLAGEVDDQTLAKMGSRVVTDHDNDKASRSDWEESYEAGLDLARQIPKKKTWAGEKVNNVKYPLIATAAIHFSARTFPNIVSANDVVKTRVIGKDANGEKASRGMRVSTHMSYQIMELMDGWKGDMDQLLAILSITGCVFKKTYYDPLEKKNVSKMILPDDFVVNYFARSLESASQLTHVIELTPNEIYERIQSGTFSDFTYTGTASSENKQDQDNEDTPHTFYEQHRYWDIDGDGYKEPYIITVHVETNTVVRIVARFDIDNIERNSEKEIVRIIPNHLFTRYLFMPAFDGSIYGMGFGILLSPLNEVVNETLNDLLDAGGLHNRQSGFVGSGINLGKGGSLKFKKGEWKQIRFNGDDLRKNLVPLPTHEPSLVLFQLLGLMIDAGKELSSVTDVLRGEQPQGDVPATTTLALIEQGLKVFSAIYGRIHESLKSEYKKIRRLNELYLNDEDYNMVLDEEEDFIAKDEYGDRFLDIIPISSTADVSDVQKMLKGKALMEVRGMGLNDQVITRRYLEALQVPDIEEILKVPEPETPWEQIREQAELELERDRIAIDQRKLNIEEFNAIEKGILSRAKSVQAIADAESKEEGIQMGVYKNETERLRDEMDARQKAMETIIGNNQGDVRSVEERQPGDGGDNQPDGVA